MSEIAQFTVRSRCIACRDERLTELSSGRFDEGAVADFLNRDPWGEHPAPFLRGQRWSYVRCDACGQAFHRNILNEAWNERRFSKWMSQEAIAAFAAGTRTPDNLLLQGRSYAGHILRLFKLTKEVRGGTPVRVLDFGCGYGEFLQACSLFGFDAHGVDRSAAKRDNGRVSIHESLASLPAGKFHAITLFQVLEHLDDPMSVLIDLRTRVMDGGLLVLETPDCTGVTDIRTLSDYRNIHPLEHINGFTPSTMSRMAERAGFASLRRPPAFVTTDLLKVARSTAGSVLRRPTTEQYFRTHG